MLLIFLLLLDSDGNAAQFQTLSSIQTAISHFITREFKTASDFNYTISQFDQRLKLPSCPQPLHVFIPTGILKSGRNSIGVSCLSEKKWTIFSRIQINSYQNVLVLTQPLNRGDIITPQRLTFERKNTSNLNRGYIQDPGQVINKQLVRNLAAGTILTSNHLTEPKLIKRGEKVNIQAKSAYFNIHMSGIALMDGRKGQNIRVRNIKSKRIVQATVITTGLVSVQ